MNTQGVHDLGSAVLHWFCLYNLVVAEQIYPNSIVFRDKSTPRANFAPDTSSDHSLHRRTSIRRYL